MSDAKLVTVKGAEAPAATEGETDPQSMPPNAGLGYYIFRFLNGPNGKTASEKVGELLGGFRTGQVNQHRLEVINALARYALLAGILGAAILLQLRGKLDSAIIGLLSLVTGYIFGRQKSE
ncbi:hypothetical protein [Anaeromyxobacter sp. SG17]|uniref:hypothetical protein n=1 Tax=Anaeromyxobacter sp. SG17 TaxID=2925405 RepID=UPI001F580060|nr:hypothetical protein [Anaeromyxobacter sp. SG17]